MKLKYPAEAFALGIILFSAGMKEAFAAGVLLIVSVVFAEFLKNLLEKTVPAWSLHACTYLSTGTICSSAFLVSFAFLGNALTTGTWLMTFLAGLLCARHVLTDTIDGEYGELFLESAFAWGFWILLAIIREFMGNMIQDGLAFQSKAFLGNTFAFLTAGLVLAFTNGVLKKNCRGLNNLFVVIPAAILVRPFTIASLTGIWEYVGIAWTIIVPILLFLSVKQILKFSKVSNAYRGLPADLLATGFIYMILSIY
mgnify:CR=1 FL=1